MSFCVILTISHPPQAYPHPETQAVLIFVFFNSPRDFVKLQKISDKGRFMISGYRIQRFRKLAGGLDNAVRRGGGEGGREDLTDHRGVVAVTNVT